MDNYFHIVNDSKAATDSKLRQVEWALEATKKEAETDKATADATIRRLTDELDIAMKANIHKNGTISALEAEMAKATGDLDVIFKAMMHHRQATKTIREVAAKYGRD